MAEFGKPDVVEETVDILIVGGGMAACGAGYEIGPWLEAAKAQGGVAGLIRRAGLGVAAAAWFTRLYLLPAKPNATPSTVRMAPAW